MSTATTEKKKRMSVTAFLSSLILVMMVVWAFLSFIVIQGDFVYPYEPHEELEDLVPWNLELDWAGGRTNWFDNINYTDLPLDQPLPPDLLNYSDSVVFIAEPADPPQLWRSTAFDHYTGLSWTKTLPDSQLPAGVIDRTTAESWGNEIYTVYINVSAGASVNDIMLPTLFPGINVIADSFQSHPDPNSLRVYSLDTDPYDTLLFGPVIEGASEDYVLISYEVTYQTQDLAALDAISYLGPAPLNVMNEYGYLPGITLSPEVLANISQFDNPDTTAYDKALAVDLYFRTTFDLILNFTDRPTTETTDWFLERGGGLPQDFASAYCVFMRELEIPARMVMGYAIGEEDNGRRLIQNQHMMFWAEVYISYDGSDGEWIQVVPIGLPEQEIPENTNPGDVQLYVFPSDFIPWALTETPFNLSAIVTVQGVPWTGAETIQFWDITDNVDAGTATIEQGSFLPLANLTYQFPSDATIGAHIFSATWQTPEFTVTNFTVVNAVAQANPMQPSTQLNSPGFEMSGTVDMDLQLGWDNYTAYWQDTILVNGIMTVGGNPVNGSDLTNRWIQIMWDDGVFLGNATIDSDGYYELSVLIDPTCPWMSLGLHEVWALYAGEYDDFGIPIILPGRSSDNSTVDVMGTVGFSFTATPNPLNSGEMLTFSGIATLLNGTPLDSQDIDIYFNGTLVNSTTTDGSGNFVGYWTLPSDYPAGDWNATVSWTSTIPMVASNWSSTIVTVLSGATDLTIDSSPIDPQPAYILQNITIYGYLTLQSNGSGLVGRYVDIYWYNGTSPAMHIGHVQTGAGGYYELNFTVPAGYEGPVEYWAEFAGDAQWDPSYAGNLTITVKRWDTVVSIDVDVNPVHPLQNVTITGNVTLPEYFGVPLGNVTVDLYWWNSTGPWLIGQVTSSIIDGQYTYEYTVPYYHEYSTFPIYAEFVSVYPDLSSNQSQNLMLTVNPHPVVIDLYSNSTYYHLNETAHIWGQLTFLENGTPLVGETVYIEWFNGTGTYTTPVSTNVSGWFDYYYAFSTSKDSDVSVTVTANFTSSIRIIDNSTQSTILTIQLYQLTLATTAPSTAHLDEVIPFTGTLTFDEGGVPLSGATIAIHYRNSTHHEIYFKTTNSTGGFYFQYNLTMNDLLGAVYIWGHYTSTNPLLWENSLSTNYTVTLTKYLFTLTLFTNGTSFNIDETVHIWGSLTYEHNSTPLGSQTIWISWSNGSYYEYGPYYTDGAGVFHFYYNFSLGQDATPGSIDVWARFNTTNPMWNNTSSAPETLDVDLYDFDLTCTTLGGTTFFIDDVIHVQGRLTYNVNGTPRPNQPIRIYWLWDNGTELFYDGSTTNSSGYYDFYYTMSLPKDHDGTATIWASFITSNPMWNNVNSSSVGITLAKYTTVLTVTPSPSTLYLNETITIYAVLAFTNSTPIQNAPVTIWWDDGTPMQISGVLFTNSTGGVMFPYSGMDNDLILSVQVYAVYAGNASLTGTTAPSQPVTLQRWNTEIAGFDIGGVFTYRILDTIAFTGTLNYLIPGPYPFGNALVRFYLGVTEVGTNTTLSDGSFIFRYQIPEGTSTGTYDVSVSFISADNWIESASVVPISIDIEDVLLDWSSFSATPNPAFLDGSITVSGNLLFLNNGSPFAFAPIEIYWDYDTDPIYTTTTDLSGYYIYVMILNETIPTGLVNFWASCTPTQSYIVASSSGTTAVDILLVPVDMQYDFLYTPTLYRDHLITVQGNLTFGDNGSAMLNHDIELSFGGQIVHVHRIIDPVAGSFLFSYRIPWDSPLGIVEFYIAFSGTGDDILELPESTHIFEEVRDSVTITLDPRPVASVIRGEDWIWVSGLVENGGGPIAGVPLSVLIAGTEETTGTTAIDGTFQLRLDMPNTYQGPRLITVDVQSGNYYDSSSLESWNIEFRIPTTATVIFTQRNDATPGGTFSTQYQLLDDLLGNGLTAASVSFYLNGTYVSTVVISGLGPHDSAFSIPTIDAGYYILEFNYAGAGYYEGSQAETNAVIHIYVADEVVLESSTPTALPLGSQLTISGQILDAPIADGGRPVSGLQVTIYLNGTRVATVTTSRTGEFSYTFPTVFSEQGWVLCEIDIQINSVNYDVYSRTITIGDEMQLQDIVPFIALAGAIVVVLLYLYFVKGMFRPTITPTGVDIPAKLRNIKKLADAGKYSEAITLAYRTFEQMCGMKIGSERLHSETAREYLERVLKSLPLDAATIEEFVQTYEEARFSDHEISRERYELAIKIFTDIYPRIEGSRIITVTE